MSDENSDQLAGRGEATPSALLTIGYGARECNEFVALLRRHGVKYLVDIRSKPFSKFNPEFSKGPIQELLRHAGFTYVFMGDVLGGLPDDPGCYVNGKVDYQAVRERGWFRCGLARLESGWRAGRHIAIMCSELEPERCHRSKLVGEALSARGVEVMHIDGHGTVISHTAAMARVNTGQATLFDLGLTSRRRYRPVHDGEPV